MSKKKILLTGDDGYNSAGTRLLIYLLRDDFDLSIAATATQQSAMGGKISLADGFDWYETEVDGIPALCVAGTPADAAELAITYYKEPFDAVISGLNWGANLGTAVFGSGTVNAALRALSVGLAEKAIAISWDLPPKYYVAKHEADHDISAFLTYPGNTAADLIREAFAHNFWGAPLLNINLPNDPSKGKRFTKAIESSKDIYDYTASSSGVEEEKNIDKLRHFTYTAIRKYTPNIGDDYDVKALTDGYISITPCTFSIFDHVIYEKITQV
jgi:5'-nucleotidase